MAIKLENKPFVNAPDSDYPYGAIRDKSVTERGTPVNTEVYGDFHQFFEKMMAESGITHNDLPDNEYSGFQLFQSLINVMNKKVLNNLFLSELTQEYTTDDLIIVKGCEIVANIPGTSTITAGIIYYNGIMYEVEENLSISTPSNTLVFNIDTSTQPEKIYLSNAVSGTGIADYNGATVKYKIRLERFNIGPWDMDSSGTLQIVLKVDKYNDFKNKVLNVDVSILSDAGLLQSPYSSSGIDCFYDDVVAIGGDDLGIRLTRLTGGKFDNTSFNDAVMNRGYVYVTWGDI